jgi:hypothetical protein
MFRFFSVLTVITATFCALWRIEQFGLLEMISDQAFFTQWVLRLANADHFLPLNVDRHGWLQALMHDEQSFLNILLRQIYQAHMVLFTIVSTLLFTLASLVIGASMESVIQISVMSSALALVLLAYFPVLCRPTSSAHAQTPDIYIIGLLALTGGCLSSFFNIFSAMGPHNVGVMFLLMAAITTQRWLTLASNTDTHFANRQVVLLMFGVQLLANYSHYTNVFILAPATVIAIAVDPSLELARRFRNVVKFSAVTFVTFLPALMLIAVYSDKLGGSINDQTFAGNVETFMLSSGNTSGHTVGERAAIWYRDVTTIYTAPGLFLGVLGVFGMAWRDRIILPAAIVSVHFLAGSFMAIFGQYDRTAAYLLPMLILGSAWLLVNATRFAIEQRRCGRPKYIGASLLVALLITALSHHAIAEYSRLMDPANVWRWGKRVGKADWRPIISEIEATVPVDSVVIPWSYGLSHQFLTMSKRYGQDLYVTRPLETFVSNWKARELRQYIEARGLALSNERPIFVLAPGDTTPERLSQDLRHVFGNDGFNLPGIATTVTKHSWNTSEKNNRKPRLHLFEVIWR